MDFLELPLDWSGSAAPVPALGSGPTTPVDGSGAVPSAPDWVGRLDGPTAAAAAALARERRPLLFLVDDRNRWHLVEPRLRIAGLDASDLADRPEGEFRMVVPADADAADVAHLLRTFRELRPPRPVVTERMAADSASVAGWFGGRRNEGGGVKPLNGDGRKNPGTGA